MGFWKTEKQWFGPDHNCGEDELFHFFFRYIGFNGTQT